MEMPLPEILDRMCIVKLKIERIKEPHLKEEFKEYEKALEEFKSKSIMIKEEWLSELYEVHKKIWDLEADIRKCRENKLGLEEVGRRALLIRDINKKRIDIKNKIIEATGQGFKDIKINYGSKD